MKPLRVVLPLFLMAFASVAFAQSDAQKNFDKLKTLAGTWEGTFQGSVMHVTLRVTSMGNAVIHEMKGDGPDDPITMIYLEGDRLLLTHYCDAGNRPRMAGKMSADGKTLAFDYLDAANLSDTQEGHMQRAVFTFGDAGHHTEEWTFAINGKGPFSAPLELHRTK